MSSDSESQSSSQSDDDVYENLGSGNVGNFKSHADESEDADIYEPSLPEVLEEMTEIVIELSALENRVANSPTISTVNEVKSRIANIFGILEDLQYEIDALSDPRDKVQRRQAIDDIDSMFTRIADLSDKCVEVLHIKADDERTQGNSCFKRQEYLPALKHYGAAIEIEPKNATLYTNRALAFQKLDKLDLAIDDAKKAVELDVNFLKAYVILIKCQIGSGQIEAAASSISDVPNEFQDRSELVELKQLTAVSAKDSGNSFFKAGDINESIRMYTVAISCDPEAHVYYSNRSAAYQSRKSFKEALSDAERCIQKCRTFAKAYVHVARCQIQLKRFEDAERTVTLANTVLEGTADLASIAPQLSDISLQAHQAKQQRSTREAVGPSAAVKAGQFKDQGNRFYQQEDYQEAIRYYSQALSLLPEEGSYYGNRAAAWLMMREYKRAIKDCVQGLGYEKQVGALDKLRLRHATALAASGDVSTALTVLGEAIALPGREIHDNVSALQQFMEKIKQAQQYKTLGLEAMESNQFSRARRLLQNAQTAGLTNDPHILLGLAKAALGLREYEESSRLSQKVIEIDGGIVESYLVRSDALICMGCTDMAEKHMKAALQRDPDNSTVQLKLKSLRKMVSELSRVRQSIDTAMGSRMFDAAITACSEGLNIDKENHKICAEMHAKKCNIYNLIAQQHKRAQHQRVGAEAQQEEGSSSDNLSQSKSAWKKALQEANSSLYYDSSVSNISTILLKCACLQGLERFDEACNELENCCKGIGEDDATVQAKYKEAKRLLKKSKRVDLYKILGIEEHATEAEIKKAYKRSALRFHPDRHSSKGDVEKKEAEDKFKQIGDAFELLTDPQRKNLYDQGYDREEIEQKVEEQKQRQEHASRGYGYGHGHGHGGHGF